MIRDEFRAEDICSICLWDLDGKGIEEAFCYIRECVENSTRNDGHKYHRIYFDYGDYETSIQIKGDREKTEKEKQDELKKEEAIRAREYAQYLDLKKKFGG